MLPRRSGDSYVSRSSDAQVIESVWDLLACKLHMHIGNVEWQGISGGSTRYGAEAQDGEIPSGVWTRDELKPKQIQAE